MCKKHIEFILIPIPSVHAFKAVVEENKVTYILFKKIKAYVNAPIHIFPFLLRCENVSNCATNFLT